MIRVALPLFILAIASSGFAIADDKKEAGKQSAFEQFKQLAGEWVGKGGPAGDEMRVTYKVTSGGSAVIETITPGSDHEMVTMIHPDGDDLILTHYCMLGNQPQMKAPGKADGNKVAFKFVKATNLKSDKDMYMHDATFTFVDKDTVKAEWTHFQDGKASGSMVIELKRKK